MPRLILTKSRGSPWGLNLRVLGDYPQGAYIVGVSDVSPAKAQGMTEGDVIISINGKSLEGLSIQSIQKLFMDVDMADIEYLRQPPKAATQPTTTSTSANRTTSTDTTVSRSIAPPVIDLISSSDEDPDEDDEQSEKTPPHPLSQTRALPLAAVRLMIPQRNMGRNSSMEVIDLVSDDEDEPPRQAPRLEVGSSVRTNSTPISTSQKFSQSSILTKVVASTTPASHGTSISSPTEGGPISYPYKRKHGKIEIKVEYEPKGFGEANIGDELIELPNPKHLQEQSLDTDVGNDGKKRSFAAAFDDDEDEIVIVGENMNVASDMPHQREACTRNMFKYNGTKGNQSNFAHCPNCYCYVCEVKASDCSDWIEHCNANCRDVKWKQLRNTHNTPMMKLLTPSQKSSFLKKYERLFSNTQNANSYDESDEDDDYYGYGHMFSSVHRGQKQLDTISSCISSIRDLFSGVNSSVSASSSSSGAGSKSADDYMEASALLIRLLGLSNFYSKVETIKSLLVQWVCHSLYTNALHEALKKTLDSMGNQAFNQSFIRAILFLPSFIKDPNGKRDQMKSDIFECLNGECLKFVFMRVIEKADEETIRQILTIRTNDSSNNVMLLLVIAKSISLNATHRVSMIEQILISTDEATFGNYLKNESSCAGVDGLTFLKILAVAIDVYRAKKIPALKVATLFVPLLRIMKIKNPLYEDLDILRNNYQANELLVQYISNQLASTKCLLSLLSCPALVAFSSNAVGLSWKESIDFTLAFLCIFADLQMVETAHSSQGGLTSFIPSMKKVATIEHHLSGWLCGNVLASWFYPQIGKYSSHQVVSILEGIAPLMSLFFSASLGKGFVCFFTHLHPWILHSYTRLPTITSFSGMNGVSSGEFNIQFRLSNSPDIHCHQLRAKESSKVALIREIFRPLGLFTTNRQLIVGNYLTTVELSILIKLLSTLLSELEVARTEGSSNLTSANNTVVTSATYNNFYQTHRGLFMLVWKSVYMNLFADAHSIGSYWTEAQARYSTLFSVFRTPASCLNWQALAENIDQLHQKEVLEGQSFSYTSGTDLERRIFFHSMGILQAHCIVPSNIPPTSSAVQDVVKLKKAVQSFAGQLIDDVSKVSMDTPYFVSMRLAIENFYLSVRESSSGGNYVPETFRNIWDEWRYWSGIVCSVVRHDNDDRAIVKLVTEDFTDLTGLGAQWQKLGDYTLADLDWSPLSSRSHLIRVAKELQDYFSNNTSPSSPFSKFKEVSVVALQKADSILNKCLSYFSIEYLQRQICEVNPIVFKVIAELYIGNAQSTHATIYQNIFQTAAEEVRRKRQHFAAITEGNALVVFDLIQSMAFLGQMPFIPETVKTKESLKIICGGTGRERKARYGSDKNAFTILIRQVLLNIQSAFMGAFIRFFEDSIRENFIIASFRDQMSDVAVVIDRALSSMSKNERSADTLYLALFNFYYRYNEDSFLFFWNVLCDFVKMTTTTVGNGIDATQFITKIASFCELMRNSSLLLGPNTWKTEWQIMYHMDGIDKFLLFILDAQLKNKYTDVMIEQLIVVLIERVYHPNSLIILQHEGYQEQFLIAVGTCLMTLPGVGKDLRCLLQSLPVCPLLQPKVPISPLELSSMNVTKTFSQLLILSLQDTNKMSENVRIMSSFAWYSSCKDQVFACLSDPSDPGVTLNLMLGNRMFVAIGEYLKKRIEISASVIHTKSSDVGLVATSATVSVRPVAIAMDIITSLIRPVHLMSASTSTTSLSEDTVLAELHSSTSLLRVMYKCCVYLQLRFFAVNDPGQQPLDANDLKTAVTNFKKAIWGMIQSCCFKCGKLISSFLDCFVDVLSKGRFIELCSFYQDYAAGSTPFNQ